MRDVDGPRLSRDEWRVALAAEMRGVAAIKQKSGRDLAHALGVSGQYMSRRRLGQVEYSVGELLVLCDLMDEDISRVLSRAKARAVEAKVVLPRAAARRNRRKRSTSFNTAA